MFNGADAFSDLCYPSGTVEDAVTGVLPAVGRHIISPGTDSSFSGFDGFFASPEKLSCRAQARPYSSGGM